jgi:hypothetical protein
MSALGARVRRGERNHTCWAWYSPMPPMSGSVTSVCPIARKHQGRRDRAHHRRCP